jgi:hypothetical protein
MGSRENPRNQSPDGERPRAGDLAHRRAKQGRASKSTRSSCRRHEAQKIRVARRTRKEDAGNS